MNGLARAANRAPTVGSGRPATARARPIHGRILTIAATSGGVRPAHGAVPGRVRTRRCRRCSAPPGRWRRAGVTGPPAGMASAGSDSASAAASRSQLQVSPHGVSGARPSTSSCRPCLAQIASPAAAAGLPQVLRDEARALRERAHSAVQGRGGRKVRWSLMIPLDANAARRGDRHGAPRPPTAGWAMPCSQLMTSGPSWRTPRTAQE